MKQIQNDIDRKNEQYAGLLSSIEKEKAEFQKSMTDQASSAKIEFERACQRVDDLEKNNEEKAKILRRSHEELEIEKRRVETLSMDLEKAKVELQDEIERIEKEKENISSNKQESIRLKEALNYERESLRTSEERKRNDLEASRNSILELEREKFHMERKISELTVKCSVNEEAKRRTDELLKSAEHQTSQLQLKENELNSKISEIDDRSAALDLKSKEIQKSEEEIEQKLKKLSSREQDIKVRLENLYLQKSAFDQELDAFKVRKKNSATLAIANVCFRKHMFESKIAFFRWHQTTQFFQNRDLLEEETRIAAETSAQLKDDAKRYVSIFFTY